MPKTTHRILEGDCLDLLPSFFPEKKRVDLIVCSPPYEDVRTYVDASHKDPFNLTGEEWVSWCLDRFEASLRASRGLVAWVVGHGKGGVVTPWSGAPFLLGADLIRRGHRLLRPIHYGRYGTPGSGGNQWLAARLEYLLCATSAPEGKLPFANNVAFGHPPKYKTGGACTNRTKDGSRTQAKKYARPKLANPGNIFWEEDLPDAVGLPPGFYKDMIWCGAAGGGNIGGKLAHESVAPFPEFIPYCLIQSYTKPGDTVMDIFGGSGTTAAIAKSLGRNSISIDIRPSQSVLTRQRLKTVQ